MIRAYAPPEGLVAGQVVLDPQESHYLASVLRLRAGAEIRVFDGMGHEYSVRLTAVTLHRVSGSIVSAVSPRQESPVRITLAQGLPKGEKMVEVVKRATELGVWRIVPLLTERTMIRWHSYRGIPRVARWQRVAMEAAKQCGRAWVPPVGAPLTLEALLASRGGDPMLVFWEGERSIGLRRGLELFPQPPARILAVVGPEGGMTDEEIKTLREGGGIVVGLGPRLLRTETAGPVATAILQYLFGDLGEVPREAEGSG